MLQSLKTFFPVTPSRIFFTQSSVVIEDCARCGWSGGYKEIWDNVVYDLAEKAKDKGIAGINDFLQTKGGLEDRYDFDITEINQEALNKLLKGEFKTLEELRENRMIKSQSENETFNSTYIVFHSKQYQEDIDKKIVFIDTIFIND